MDNSRIMSGTKTQLSDVTREEALAPVVEVRGAESWYLVGAACNNSCVECVADHGRFLEWPLKGKGLPSPSAGTNTIFIGGREPTFISRLEAHCVRSCRFRAWLGVSVVIAEWTYSHP